MTNYLHYLAIILVIIMVVTGSYAQSGINPADTIELPTIVVTAQFAPTDSRETVNTVRIIDQKTIEKRASVNLLELLQTEANLRINNDAILGSGLTINGLQSENVKILIDGVPVIGRLDGSIDLGQLPLKNIRQIEIIEGAQSLIYGSAASAGVINLITKSSQLYRTEAEVSGSIESNGYRTLQGIAGLDWGAPSISITGGLINFEPRQSSGNRDQLWNPKKQWTTRTTVGYDPHDKIHLKAAFSHFSEEVTNLGEIRRPQFKPYALDDYYLTNRTDYSLHGEGWLSKPLYWQVTTAYNDFSRVRNSYRVDLEENKEELLEGGQDTADAGGLLFRGTLASAHTNKALNYLAGFEYYRETAIGARIESKAKEQGFVSVTDLGLFSSIKYQINENLLIQTGVRGINNTRYGQALSPSLWIVWKMTGIDVKASYVRGFRSPGLKELYFNFVDINHFIVGNEDLLPETSQNFNLELTRKQKLNNQWLLTLSGRGFYNSIKNRIILAEYALSKFNYQNLEEWRSSGAGLDALLINQKLKIRSSFVYTGYHNEFTESEKVSTLLWSADWSNEISLDFLKGYSFSIWHKYTGKTPYFFLENSEVRRGETGDWHFLNASLHSQIMDKRIRITAGIKNILDIKDIRSSRSSGTAHAGGNGLRPVHWGRSFFMETKLRLHSKKETRANNQTL